MKVVGPWSPRKMFTNLVEHQALYKNINAWTLLTQNPGGGGAGRLCICNDSRGYSDTRMTAAILRDSVCVFSSSCPVHKEMALQSSWVQMCPNDLTGTRLVHI